MKEGDKELIGRREWLSIPSLGLGPLRAKIDTGARSSSLHALNIEPFAKDGEDWVRFISIDDISCEAPVVAVKKVKSSNGLAEERYYIEVSGVTLSGKEVVLHLSLSDRSVMRNPMLLGRRALSQFLVDSSRSHLFGKPSKEED